jgi:Double-stranded RNA binding motif
MPVSIRIRSHLYPYSGCIDPRRQSFLSLISVLPLIMSFARPRSSEMPDAIIIVQKFMDQHPHYELAYSFTEEGEAHQRRYQFCYTMGDEVLARGSVMSKKKKAKRCAAQKTEDVLRSRGYRL